MGKRQKLLKLVDENKYELMQEGLGFAVLSMGNADIVYGLGGSLPREKCFFDKTKLKRASSATMGQSGGPPHTYYQCPKCKLFYDLPLGEKEREEHRERLRKIVFAGSIG